MKKYFFLILYYSFARYLPASHLKYVGKTCKYIRYILCKNIFLKCGKNVNVERLAFFGTGKKLVIGDNSGLGVNCKIHNNTIIGENVNMGPNCYMLQNTHIIIRTDIPMREQGLSDHVTQVIIKNDVWIGRDVMILGDRQIETGSIVGARTVLTKNFPHYSIVGGNPSKLIRSRLGNL